MKLPWPGRKEEGGLKTAKPSSSDSAWILGDERDLANSPLGAYADQLVEEGFAQRVDGSYRIPWHSVYQLVSNEDHTSSLGLLALPATTRLRPHLVSEGTYSDSSYAIRLDHWVAHTGPLATSAVKRTGAVIHCQSGDELLPQSSWELIRILHELVEKGRSWSAHERLLAMGRIQLLARKCSATMDGYLTKTDVVVPQRLDVELIEEQTAGVPVVELIPRLGGAPDQWLEQFDAYDRVHLRYDVVQSGGRMAHVALLPAIRDVLEHVKAAPGRRYASREADAFIHNPYAFLGDNAQAVLSSEQFEAARLRAGVIERELDVLPSDNGLDLLLIDIAGNAEDVCESVSKSGEVTSLLSAATAARNAGLPLFRWRSHRVVLSGLTPAALHHLGEWVASSATTRETLGVGEVFNLKSYSDRVVGFDGKPIHVPFLGKKDAGRDWVPDNLQLSISSTHPCTGEATNVVLDADQVSQLERVTQTAKLDGSVSVRVPGTDIEIPTEEAREWLQGFNEGVKKQPSDPAMPKNPQPGHANSLRILHNIEALEYGAAVGLQSSEALVAVLPKALRQEIELKQHQRDGLAWLQYRFDQTLRGVGGTLLADDMGLGKTLQCLCLMTWYRESRPDPKPCLVVAPVSLLENWQAEIDKFFDGSQGATMPVYGQELARHRIPAAQIGDELATMGLKKLLRRGFADNAAIVLTTYETLRDYELSFGRERWGILVCDEAQKIKTPGALVTRSAKAMQAEFKIACTGTPVENSLADLWCLFDFFQPALLGSLSEFTKVFRRSIELREDGYGDQVEHLRRSIAPWILRRMKSEVADLPPKIDETHKLADPSLRSLPMSALQRKLYGEAVVKFRRDKQNVEAGELKAGTLTLALIHRLRLICSNPLAASRDDADYLSVDENVQHSPKLRWLLERLREIQQNSEKAIIFTEYRQIQRLVQKAVEQKFKVDVSIVNGATTVDSLSSQSRQKIIDQFQEKPGFGVIVLSTTAVGFGVNIQKANHVIHFTRPWNPAKEDQATDRAYRIGQDKPVWVYCPTLAGDGFESFEQRLSERLARKRALSQDLLAPEQTVNWKDFEDLID